MDNFLVLAVIGILFLFLLLFIIMRNKKDQKELEDTLNQDYRKPKHSNDIENDENNRM